MKRFSLGFGQQMQQPQQQVLPPNPNEALLTSVYKCNIFGDERDQIIGNWNMLQAFWGHGKGTMSNQLELFVFRQLRERVTELVGTLYRLLRSKRTSF